MPGEVTLPVIDFPSLPKSKISLDRANQIRGNSRFPIAHVLLQCYTRTTSIRPLATGHFSMSAGHYSSVPVAVSALPLDLPRLCYERTSLVRAIRNGIGCCCLREPGSCCPVCSGQRRGRTVLPRDRSRGRWTL